MFKTETDWIEKKIIKYNFKQTDFINILFINNFESILSKKKMQKI